MPARNKEINLVPDYRKSRTSWGVFFDWLLNIGRYIIIFTELLVIVAFVVRFKFDRDLTRLYEKIEVKKETVARQAKFEDEFRFLQEKILTIAEINADRPTPQLIIKELELITPKTISFTSFNFSANTVTIEGKAYTSTGLASFAYQLSRSPNFTDIQIGEVSRGERLEIYFNLKATWRGEVDHGEE